MLRQFLLMMEPFRQRHAFCAHGLQQAISPVNSSPATVHIIACSALVIVEDSIVCAMHRAASY
jgi:hypothetical protein